MDASPTPLSPAAARAARDLRERFGFLRDVVAEMERAVPYAAALVRFTDGHQLELRDGRQSANRRDPQAGVVLTASNGVGLEETASDATDAASVRAAARELVERTRAVARTATGPALVIEPTSPADADFATAVQMDPGQLPLADRIDRYEALRRRLREAAPQAVQAIAIHRASTESAVFVNRVGMTTQQVSRVVLVLQLIVSDGQQHRYDLIQRAGTGGLELLEIPDAALAECAETATLLLEAEPPPAGDYDVVTDPLTSGTIAHEAFGHGVETDMFVKGRARAAGYLGQRVGSELVNILDDPTVPGAFGSYFVDDEGQLAAPTVIIRDGIFQRGLSDLYSATRLGIPRTANGRRESVQRKAYARMSNTFFAAGSDTKEELISGLDDGLLVCRSLNGMEDPKGWGMQIAAHFAREVKGGSLTGRVFSPVAVTGYVPDVLAAVSGVSGELAFSAGSCGKGWKEIVPVGTGGPYLRTRCRVG